MEKHKKQRLTKENNRMREWLDKHYKENRERDSLESTKMAAMQKTY